MALFVSLIFGISFPLPVAQIGSDLWAIAGMTVMRGLHQIKQYQHVIQQQERTSITRNAGPETARVRGCEPRPRAPHQPPRFPALAAGLGRASPRPPPACSAIKTPLDG